MPFFGQADLSACFTQNFFHTEEFKFGVILLFSQLCNCTSTVFYLPVTMFQYITERLVMEKLWECYYSVNNGLEEVKGICLQNWKTITFLHIEFRKMNDEVQIFLSYTNDSIDNVTPMYVTDALAFMDYCQFFYRRFVSAVLETNNYIYEI